MKQTPTYNELLSSEPWKRKRDAILERDHNKCCNCGYSRQLQVHHRQYHVHPLTGAKREPWDYDNQYLVTLCEKCHKTGHKQYSIPTFKH